MLPQFGRSDGFICLLVHVQRFCFGFWVCEILGWFFRIYIPCVRLMQTTLYQHIKDPFLYLHSHLLQRLQGCLVP
jgi:hypothetical protein